MPEKRRKLIFGKFRYNQLLARVAKIGNLFEPVEKLKQKLPKKWQP